ncbi:MAG: OmpA family protein [Sphingobacteriaceae bacterium]|nr:OmpA family protein [Sphingobacteriaceae bacterium]
MKSFIYIIIIIPFFSAHTVAQPNIKKAKRFHTEYDYQSVITEITSTEGLDADMLRRLGESYKMSSEFQKAELVYSVLAENDNRTNEDLFQYTQLLKMNKKLDDFVVHMKEFSKTYPNEIRSQLFLNNPHYYSELQKDQKQFVIHKIKGNNYNQDFGVAFYKNKLVFASTRQPLGPLTKLWIGNRLPYLDIYTAKVNPKYDLKSISKFPVFNNKYHEGPACFNKKGKHLFFTSDNYHGKSNEGIRKLKIYEAKIEKGGKWGSKTELPFNSDEYSCGHPSLSSDELTLYFVSDMPGGFGGTDIYKVSKSVKGHWGEPVNLGEKINTEGNESFPFIHESGLLFYASDGKPGLGGLDIFVNKIIDDFISKSINIGAPINGNADDYNMILDAEQKKGYYSSNNISGEGSDDIYAYDLLKPFRFGKIIKGKVQDENGLPMHDVAIYLMDKRGKIGDKVCTKKDGSYLLFVDEGKQFKLLAKTEDYYDSRKLVSTSVNGDEITANITMEKDPGFILCALITNTKDKKPLAGVQLILTDRTGKIMKTHTPINGEYRLPLPNNKLGDTLKYNIEISKPGFVSKSIQLKWPLLKRGEQKIHEKLNISLGKVELGGDLAKLTNLHSIYFDFGKSAIRLDAAIELDKIVKIMNENPDMVVELGSHTDCRSSKAYNLKLSEQRAKASASYIKKRISKPQRITGKGYGESKLLNNCACEGKKQSTCTEEEHQKNRRTEFIIIKF